MCANPSTSTALPYGRATVDRSDRQGRYMPEGRNGSCIRLSATAYAVLTGIDGGATADEVAHDLSERLGRAVTAEYVEAAYTQVRQQVDTITERTRPKPFGLWFRVCPLPVSVVDRVSRRLSPVLRPPVAVPLDVHPRAGTREREQQVRDRGPRHRLRASAAPTGRGAPG